MDAPMRSTGSPTELSNMPPIDPDNKFDWYDTLDKMIGHRRQRFSDYMPTSGLPQPSQHPDEVKIQRRAEAVFESCAFKTVMSCVIGMI
jgi:hypothetical protein